MHSRSIGNLLRSAAAIGVSLALVTSLAAHERGAAAKLDSFHADLIKRYAAVKHISPDRLHYIAQDDVVLFDVREDSEFDVSRIEGAIRVSPSIRTSAFLRDHATSMKGKTVVFYCSVGERSSRLAERVLAHAAEIELAAIYNLEGGIFKWHNDFRDVVDASGETSAIHPFNRRWGRLIERQEHIGMKPDAE